MCVCVWGGGGKVEYLQPKPRRPNGVCCTYPCYTFIVLVIWQEGVQRHIEGLVPAFFFFLLFFYFLFIIIFLGGGGGWGWGVRGWSCPYGAQEHWGISPWWGGGALTL